MKQSPNTSRRTSTLRNSHLGWSKDSHLQLAAITQSITNLIGVVNPQRVRDWLSFRYSFNSTQISHALQNQPINLLFWAEIYSFKHFLDEIVGDAYDAITPTPPSHGGKRRLPPRLHILPGLLLDSFVAVLPELRATLPHHILARLSWLRALWFLKLTQIRPATTTNHRGLLDAFHTADLHTYSLHRRLQPGTVYIKVSHKHPAWYIGSTVHTITEREVSRRSRFNQIRAGTQSFFEPGLRIWHAADTYEHYLTIALHTRPSESQLRSLEQDRHVSSAAQRPLRLHPSPETRRTDRGPEPHDLHGKHFRQPTSTYSSPVYPLPRLTGTTWGNRSLLEERETLATLYSMWAATAR